MLVWYCLILTFFSDFIYIYIHSTCTYNIQYRKKENKTIRIVRHDKKERKNRTKTKICFIYVKCFYVVIIWLVNSNWKKSNIIFTIIWQFKIYIFSSSDHPANKRNKRQCRFNAGPLHTTPAQHQSNTWPMRRVYWTIAPIDITTEQDIRPPNAGHHSTNTGRTLRACRGYRWPFVCDAGPHSAWRQTRHGYQILG